MAGKAVKRRRGDELPVVLGGYCRFPRPPGQRRDDGAAVKHRWLPALGIALLCTACSGGGTHPTVLTAPSIASPGKAANGTARFSLTIPNASAAPASARRAAFVSPSTLSGTIAVNGGPATELDLSVASPACVTVSGGRACLISVAAPIGATDTFTLVLYSGAFTGGVHTGNALSAASNFTAAVNEGASNVTIPLILGGIPLSVDVAIIGSLVAGAPTTVPVVITAYDANNNTIVGAGNYADPTGADAPLTLAVSAPQQLMLHDGAQAAQSIQVAGPSDTVTFQLQAPANILGTYLSVKNNAGQSLHAFNLTRFVGLSGTLTSTLLGGSISYFPDDVYLAPSDNTLISGVPNGFAFSLTSASGGGFLGYLNSATETLEFCSISGGAYTLGVGSITSGIVSAFNAVDNIGSPPTGITFYPLASLTGGVCTGGSPYVSGTSGFAKSLTFDASRNELFEGDCDGNFGLNMFTPPSTLSGNSTQTTYSSVIAPHDLIALAGTTYYLTGITSNTLNGINPTVAATAGSDHLTALRNGQDGRVYALGTVNNEVYAYNGSAAMQPYTPASAFTISLSTQPNNLAIGPDGSAYATDGASTIQAVTPAGTASSVVIPPPSGNIGFLRGIFDGRNGYLYAFYDDGLHAGHEYFYRISY